MRKFLIFCLLHISNAGLAIDHIESIYKRHSYEIGIATHISLAEEFIALIRPFHEDNTKAYENYVSNHGIETYQDLTQKHARKYLTKFIDGKLSLIIVLKNNDPIGGAFYTIEPDLEDPKKNILLIEIAAFKMHLEREEIYYIARRITRALSSPLATKNSHKITVFIEPNSSFDLMLEALGFRKSHEKSFQQLFFPEAILFEKIIQK